MMLVERPSSSVCRHMFYEPTAEGNELQDGVCRLCGDRRALCRSHALPESAFRPLLKDGEGKAIVIVDDRTTPIHYSSDSWGVNLLCRECEEKLNRAYDQYGIDVLKGHRCSVSRGAGWVTFTGIDKQRFRMFFLSLLWRISVSHHECYQNINLPSDWEQEIHSALRDANKVRGSLFTVRVFRLRDSTDGGFSVNDIRNFVAAPFGRSYGRINSVCFMFFGFLAEVFLPRLPSRICSKAGFLVGKSTVFLAPYYEILDAPELINLLATGLQKHESGLSRVD
jgi:hypothetical protein